MSLSLTGSSMRWFALARKLALKSTVRRHKLGAVIVKKGKVIGAGFNVAKTHPQSRSPRSTHAELRAILSCHAQDLKGATCFVARFTRGGSPAMGQPCPECAARLVRAGVRTAYFTTNGGYACIGLCS